MSLFLRLPPSDKRANGEEALGDRSLPLDLLPWPAAQLASVPSLGRVCTKLPPTAHNGSHTVPVHNRLPTSLVSMDRGTIRGTSYEPLVPPQSECVE